MIKIMHRVNQSSDLKNIPSNLGIEVDIRSYGEELIIHHDPFKKGENFNKWLIEYDHKMLILNVKEEGLEDTLIELMKEKNIKNYFFLDQSFPFLIKHSKSSGGRSAVRFSEYESINTVLNLKNICNWVWVDCFSKNPLTANCFKKIKENNFKICLVSPELQGKDGPSEIFKLKKDLKDKKILADAVCTKHPNLW